LPSALGSDEQITLTGNIDLGPQGIQSFSLYTPQGVNQETIIYPYLQMGVGLGHGFEVAGKFSGHVQLVHGYYQVYGASLKYNLGQWWPKLTQHKWNAAVLLAYNNEKVAYETFKANDPTAQSLLGGIDVLLAKVNTFQLQYHMSKTFGRFEFLSGVLGNYSTFRYQVDGNDTSTLTYQGNSLNTLLNRQLETIAKNKWNLIGELSCRYALWKHTFAQTTFAFGKFANWNGSIQFEF
jgi:hypothetical protein